MPGVVTKSPEALRDLDGIASFLQQADHDVAHRFLRAAERAFALLAAQPLMGQAYPHPRHSELRVWPIRRRFRKYLVFYRPIPGGVDIVRVLHGARDLPRVLQDDDN
jgi:toxin ParE1/3/4